MSLDAHWIDIKPGDVGFDGGVGISGWLIRHATGIHGHTWVYHEFLRKDSNGNDVWRTVEAGPKDGVIFRERTRRPNKVVRLWETPIEQQRILDASANCVGAKYGWGEIARIVWHLLGIRYEGTKDNPNRMICSNHVATAVAAANKATKYTMPYKPNHIWPQRLAQWADWYLWTKSRNRENKPTRYYDSGYKDGYL